MNNMLRHTVCFVFCLAPIAFASDAGRNWGVERTCYPDPVTKIRICEMTTEGAAQNLYFHAPNVTADDKYLIVDSDRTGQWQAYRADLKTGRIVQLTDVAGGIEAKGQAPGVTPHRTDPRKVFYIAKSEAKAGEVFEVDVETAVSRRIGVLPPSSDNWYRQPTVSHDGRSLTFGFRSDQKTWEIGMMDIATGQYRVVLRQGFSISHMQHSPVAPLIFYVWETGNYAPQRTWLVNTDGTGNRPLYYRATKTWITERKENITHEAWVQKTGDMTMVSIKTGLYVVKPTGEYRLAVEGEFNHGAPDADGRRAVLDDAAGNLWLADLTTGKKRMLATGLQPGRFPGFHPHPTFDWKGQRVIFNTARNRKTVAVIDLSELPPEAPDAH